MRLLTRSVWDCGPSIEVEVRSEEVVPEMFVSIEMDDPLNTLINQIARSFYFLKIINKEYLKVSIKLISGGKESVTTLMASRRDGVPINETAKDVLAIRFLLFVLRESARSTDKMFKLSELEEELVSQILGR